MKKGFVLQSLIVMLTVSCSVNEMDTKDAFTPSDEIFYATLESYSEPDTKVYVDENVKILWDEDDRVTIFNKYTYNQEYRFLGETGDNAGGFRKVPNDDFVTGNDLDNVFAVYPYLESTKISNDEVMTITLPAEQSYRENSFGPGANVMTSATEDNMLRFKNVGGYLVLKFYGEGVSVSSIKLEGNNGERLSGKATVTHAVGGSPSSTMTTDAGTSITLTCENPVELAANKVDASLFWLVVPPTDFTGGFTLTVTDKNGGVFVKETTKNLTISRNGVLRISPIEVVIAESTVIPETIDMGLSVKWASFNLGASVPEEYGDYFAWAETRTYYSYNNDNSYNFSLHQQGYDWSTYQWISLGQEYTNIKRYCPTVIPTGDCRWAGPGSPDNKTEFADYNYVDDAARANWKGEWRTPSEAEWSELLNNCSWEWKGNYNGTGINGYLVTGTKPGYTNQSIFLPAAGWYRKTYNEYSNSHGEYWSSSLYINRPDNAWYLGFWTDGSVYMQYTIRPSGGSIRPVFGNPILVTSVHLNCYGVSLYEGDTFTLSANVSPSTIENQSVVWSSSDPSVVSVNNGVLEAITEGAATITVSRDGKEATCEVIVFRNATSPEAIDLGLSVKWASCNVGSQKPEEYGDYFAWGETEPYYQPGYAQSDNPEWKSEKDAGYDWLSYKWCNGSANTLTRYCASGGTSYWGGSDSPDGKIQFADYNYVDDAARANWEGGWRIPTTAEWSELQSKCDWIKTSLYGINGYVITSKENGKRLFLPAAGFRSQRGLYSIGSGFCYWASRISSDPPSYAYSLRDLDEDGDWRYYGFSVRPVTD